MRSSKGALRVSNVCLETPSVHLFASKTMSRFQKRTSPNVHTYGEHHLLEQTMANEIKLESSCVVQVECVDHLMESSVLLLVFTSPLERNE